MPSSRLFPVSVGAAKEMVWEPFAFFHFCQQSEREQVTSLLNVKIYTQLKTVLLETLQESFLLFPSSTLCYSHWLFQSLVQQF